MFAWHSVRQGYTNPVPQLTLTVLDLVGLGRTKIESHSILCVLEWIAKFDWKKVTLGGGLGYFYLSRGLIKKNKDTCVSVQCKIRYNCRCFVILSCYFHHLCWASPTLSADPGSAVCCRKPELNSPWNIVKLSSHSLVKILTSSTLKQIKFVYRELHSSAVYHSVCCCCCCSHMHIMRLSIYNGRINEQIQAAFTFRQRHCFEWLRRWIVSYRHHLSQR